MKKVIFAAILLLLAFQLTNGQNSKQKNSPAGKWLFEAPTAPQGFQSGIIEVGFADSKYSASMAFPGNENKLPGDQVKFVNDTLTFNVYIESQDIAVTLTLVDGSAMKGKAVYSDGEVALSLKRENKQDK